MRDHETESAISKEHGLCAAENGDGAIVCTFLSQLLPQATYRKLPDPEQPHQDAQTSPNKTPNTTRLREVVAAIFETAIENGQSAVIRDLWSSTDIRERLRVVMPPRWEQQLLIQAIQADYIDIVACLLDHGIDIESSANEDKGSSDQDHSDVGDDHLPLCMATALGSVEIVQLLLAKGFNVNARCRTTDQCAPVFTAASRNESDILAFLLHSSDTVDADALHPMTRETALHVAAKRGHVECVAALLASKRASVNAINRVGSSALHLAYVQGGGSRSKEVVRMLEAAGARRICSNKKDTRPSH
jgi:hypothetical protein